MFAHSIQNWWFPEPVRKVLRVRAEPALETD